MAGEVAQVGNDGLYFILVPAMLALRNVRAQRDRLLQLRRLLSPRSHGDDDDAAGVEEAASGLQKIYSDGLYRGAGYLADCLETAAENGNRVSFSIYAFAAIPDEQLYGVLMAQFFPPHKASQAQAFARIESAYYAAMLSLEHHLPRCIELLIGVRPPPVGRKPNGGWIGYSDNPVAAANEHLAKMLKDGFPDPNPNPDPAPAAAATDMPPLAKSIVDLDQALSYLHRACSLTILAVKHLDDAVTYLSSFLDPEEVADMCERADKHVYISEDGPYQSESEDSD